jgi:hypothetical protein
MEVLFVQSSHKLEVLDLIGSNFRYLVVKFVQAGGT